jgi:hypothetical protein
MKASVRCAAARWGPQGRSVLWSGCGTRRSATGRTLTSFCTRSYPPARQPLVGPARPPAHRTSTLTPVLARTLTHACPHTRSRTISLARARTRTRRPQARRVVFETTDRGHTAVGLEFVHAAGGGCAKLKAGGEVLPTRCHAPSPLSRVRRQRVRVYARREMRFHARLSCRASLPEENQPTGAAVEGRTAATNGAEPARLPLDGVRGTLPPC